MRISDWRSDVCSSDLIRKPDAHPAHLASIIVMPTVPACSTRCSYRCLWRSCCFCARSVSGASPLSLQSRSWRWRSWRSDEHTSELHLLLRTPYAVFCLIKKTIDTLYSVQMESQHMTTSIP